MIQSKQASFLLNILIEIEIAVHDVSRQEDLTLGTTNPPLLNQ